MIASGHRIAGTAGDYVIDAVLHASPQPATCRAAAPDGRPVVLKEPRVDKLPSWKVLDLFERESEVLKQLDHPRLPRWVDGFRRETEQDTCLYLVCSWAPGQSLLEK